VRPPASEVLHPLLLPLRLLPQPLRRRPLRCMTRSLPHWRTAGHCTRRTRNITGRARKSLRRPTSLSVIPHRPLLRRLLPRQLPPHPLHRPHPLPLTVGPRGQLVGLRRLLRTLPTRSVAVRPHSPGQGVKLLPLLLLRRLLRIRLLRRLLPLKVLLLRGPRLRRNWYRGRFGVPAARWAVRHFLIVCLEPRQRARSS
jgi:hypothetical protein